MKLIRLAASLLITLGTVPSCGDETALARDPDLSTTAFSLAAKDSLPNTTPRSLAIARDGTVAILDDNSTVHLFPTLQSQPVSFRLPEGKKGSPGGNPAFFPDGALLVADTHYHRVLEIDSRSGRVTREYGEYGDADGQFVYPLAVAIRPLGTDGTFEVFVSEYGKEDRIQVFDRRGRFLRSFSSRGSEPGQLDRATGLCFSTDDRLYVADSCNHRIQIFHPDGRLDRIVEGSLRFPYAVAVDPNDVVWVVEYGSSRVTAMSQTGQILWRSDPEKTEGMDLMAPRGLALLSKSGRVGSGRLFSLLITDTGNRRVVQIGATSAKRLLEVLAREESGQKRSFRLGRTEEKAP